MNDITGQIDQPDICWDAPMRRKKYYFHCELCGEKKERDKMAIRQRTCTDKCKPIKGLIIHCSNCGEPKGYDDYYDYRDASYGRFQWECRACKSRKGCVKK